MKIYNIQTISLDNNAVSVKLSNDKVASEVAQAVYLQVSGESFTSLAIAGKTKENETAQSLAAIAMADLSKKTTIVAAGIYMVAAEALTSITLTAVGECEVVVKGIR